MFLTRLGRKIGLHLKSVSGNLESLDIWKIIEILASCNCDLDTVDTIEQSKLKDVLGAMSDLEFLQKCTPILLHDSGVPSYINRLSNRKELLTSVLLLKAIAEEDRDSWYKQYLELAKLKGCSQLPITQFKDLVCRIFDITLSPDEMSIYKTAYKDMIELMCLMSDELGEPKQRQYGICLSIIKSKRFTPREIYDEFREKATFSTIDARSRKVAFVRLCEIVKKANILNVLSALFLGKRTLLYGKDKSSVTVTPELLAENDIMLENGLVYELFTANVCDPLDAEFERESLIINPSPFFIRKWHEDLRLRERKVKFVLTRDEEAEILRLYFSNRNQSGVFRDEYSVVSFKEFVEDCRKKTNLDFSNILLFRLSELGTGNNMLKDIIDKCPEDSYIYSLSSDESFLSSGELPYEILRDTDPICENSSGQEKTFVINYVIDSILTIPTGLGGTHPRRKSLWLARKVHIVQKDPITVSKTWYLDSSKIVDQNNHSSIALHSADYRYLPFTLKTYLDSKKSLREFLRFESVPEDRLRDNAKFIDYSREIRIWYTMQKGIKKPGTKRIEVYVCAPLEEDSEAIRGNRIEASVKHKADLEPDLIEGYVKWKYVYDHYSTKKSGELKRVEIRDVISKNFRIYLNEQAITLRTFLYIYTELDSRYSDDDELQMLKTLRDSSLADRIIEQIAYEDYQEYLQIAYPQRTQSFYSNALSLISDVLDFAIEKKHSNINVIDECEAEKESFDNQNKYAAQVRAALVKKSFSMAELQKLYDCIVSNLHRKSDGYLYLGLLIRLLTGLSSREVCALRYKDFQKVPGYQFYQLHVYAKVTHNSKGIEPFRKAVEFRCIPCSGILATAISVFCERKALCQDDYIISDKKEQTIVYPTNPKFLDRLGATVLKELKIGEELSVSIPDKEKGRRTLDLHKFEGDIFRSNFQYIASRQGKLNADEIAYVRGIARATTFGIYYCDYSSSRAQAVLHSKIQRLDALFIKGKVLVNEISSISDNENHKFAGTGRIPIQLDISVMPDEQGRAVVDISSMYGVSVIKDESK